MDPFCCVLHQFGPRFAAFCINLGPVLLRSALIWARFAVFCINLGPFCCVLHQLGLVLLRSALIWAPFCCVLHQFNLRTLSCAEIWKTFFAHRCAHFPAQSCAKCTQLCATVRNCARVADARIFAHRCAHFRAQKAGKACVAHRCAHFCAHRALRTLSCATVRDLGSFCCVLH